MSIEPEEIFHSGCSELHLASFCFGLLCVGVFSACISTQHREVPKSHFFMLQFVALKIELKNISLSFCGTEAVSKQRRTKVH